MLFTARACFSAVNSVSRQFASNVGRRGDVHLECFILIVVIVTDDGAEVADTPAWAMGPENPVKSALEACRRRTRVGRRVGDCPVPVPMAVIVWN